MTIEQSGLGTNAYGSFVELGKYRPVSHDSAYQQPAGLTDGGVDFQSLLRQIQQSQADPVTSLLSGDSSLPPDDGFFRAFSGELAATDNSSAASSLFTLPSSKIAAASSLSAIQKATKTASSDPMSLTEYPRPVGDNGRGIHWVPTTSSSPEVVDRFVNEALAMKSKWVTILNDGTDTQKNDYLVKKLVDNGIMPVMRVYTPNGAPIQGDLGAMVRHYKSLGVSYFQLYNEPNNNGENPGGVPDVKGYVDKWLAAAKVVTANGGLPGFAALSPGGNVDDLQFMRDALTEIKNRGELGALDKAWVAMHNYTFNRPIDYTADSNGFLKFQWYDKIINEVVGRNLPLIGTEGGVAIGSNHDPNYPPVDESRQAQLLADAYGYMDHAEPYFFAYSTWVIANEAGGGTDPAFSSYALIRPDGANEAVDVLKRLA
jgi:hypothetical protein